MQPFKKKKEELEEYRRKTEQMERYLARAQLMARFRSFYLLTTFTSLVFVACGTFLIWNNSLSIELGGPLVTLSILSSVVFSVKLYQIGKKREVIKAPVGMIFDDSTS